MEHDPRTVTKLAALRRATSGGFTPAQAEKQLSQKQVSTLLDYALGLSVMRDTTGRPT
jgi:hypothetical protein